MALDERGWVAIDGYGFDDVRVQSALREEFGFADLTGGFLKHINKGVADDLSLGLGVSDALEFFEE